MTVLLGSVGTLAIILIGIAIILQIASLKEVFSFIARVAMAFALLLVALCILKSLWVGAMIPWLSAVFESLKTLIAWLFVTILSLVALALIGRLVFRRFEQQLTLRRKSADWR